MKKIIGNERVTNAPLPSFITLKKNSTKDISLAKRVFPDKLKITRVATIFK